MSILIHGCIFFIASFVLAKYCWSRPYGTVGLPICYATLLFMIHFGAFIYLLPWYDPQADASIGSMGFNINEVSTGYAMTTIGMVAFTFGVILSESIFTVKHKPSNLNIKSTLTYGRQLVAIGAIFFFVIFPISSRLPSGAAIANAGMNLSVIGLCLLAFTSLGQFTAQRIRVILATLSIPSITILLLGFVGYGVSALINIASFTLCFVRGKWWHVPVAGCIFYLMLCLYVSYISGREEIRGVVWRGASYVERFQIITEKALEAQLFDPLNNKHLAMIDGRLNQNTLVGRSVYYMRATNKDHAMGQSLYVAAVAWIPRIVWPNKPSFGGSGKLVSEYTGMIFDESTSVGVGLVLELYLNFGVTGVVLGFMGFGLCIRYLDRLAASSLQNNDLLGYTKYHLIGMSCMHPGGVLAEVVGSSAAAFCLMYMLHGFLKRQRIFSPAAILERRPRKGAPH